MALWCACAANDVMSKIMALWWPIMGFVAIGYEHCVANMFFVPLAIMEGYNLTADQFIRRNLIPVTLGNIVGGLLFIAVQYLIYHPYIEADVTSMTLNQGSRESKTAFRQSEIAGAAGVASHHVPGYRESIFKDVHERLSIISHGLTQKDPPLAQESNVVGDNLL
jgi:hypothetical protein